MNVQNNFLLSENNLMSFMMEEVHCNHPEAKRITRSSGELRHIGAWNWLLFNLKRYQSLCEC